jgi:hypothetical protein
MPSQLLKRLPSRLHSVPWRISDWKPISREAGKPRKMPRLCQHDHRRRHSSLWVHHPVKPNIYWNDSFFFFDDDTVLLFTLMEQILLRSCITTWRSSIFLLPFLIACTDTGWRVLLLKDNSVQRLSNFWLLRNSKQTLLILDVTSCISFTGS